MTTSENSSELAELRRKLGALELDVQRLVSHDQLTGLTIRAAFLKQVEQHLESAKDQGQQSAIIEIGIRGIPRITGAMGRHVGDYVIAALAARLTAALDHEKLVCRLDYWSFAIFLPRVADALEALTAAKKIIQLLSEPVDWVERTLTIEAAAGVALAGKNETDATTLLHRSGLALKSAAEKGGPGYAFFNPALEQAAKRKQDIQLALHDAIANQYFFLNFQPYFKADGGELVGFEALLRLKHPAHGFVSPAEFIPVAEETGLINRIGAWALAEACRVASTWPDNLIVSVNFSPEQFVGGSLITDVHNALELYSFPAYRLEVEITESTMMGDNEIISSQVAALRELGCHIVMDDFGTGYSSLSYLKRFPIDALKIDRSFVRDISDDPDDAAIVSAIISMAKSLKQEVVAEGVETQAQLEFLRQRQCDQMQGFLFSKPVSAQALAQQYLKGE
jgi:diguanylate cyclase (GGDEF)-like protein